MKTSFYLVWSPNGSRPPSYRHANYSSAETEARRMAECWPGSQFFVLEAQSVSMKNAVVTYRFPIADDIPF